VLDKVDDIYAGIKELSLNHNQLVSLDGIEQFRCLEVLSLNFNRLASRAELLKLTSPHLLREINVRGNPGLESPS
jgi:Leucine-rich repeat (LRR) protein